MIRDAPAPETFRPWMALRTVVMAADTLWIGTLFALALMNGATKSAFRLLSGGFPRDTSTLHSIRLHTKSYTGARSSFEWARLWPMVAP